MIDIEAERPGKKEAMLAIPTFGVMAPQTVHLAVMMDIDGHVKMARKANEKSGYPNSPYGVEVWSQPPTISRQIRDHDIKPDTLSHIVSTHQNPILGGPAGYILPGLHRSLRDQKTIDEMRNKAGLTTQHVVFKETYDRPDSRQIAQGLNAVIQLDPELWDMINARNLQDVIDWIKQNNLRAVLDTAHIRRKNKNGDLTRYPEPARVIDALYKDYEAGKEEKPLLAEIHIGERPDLPAVDPETSVREEKDLINGTEGTSIFPILKRASNHGFRGIVVFESHPATTKEAIKGKTPLLRRGQIVDALEDKFRNVRQVFPAIPA